jgi:hypothetical protein
LQLNGQQFAEVRNEIALGFGVAMDEPAHVFGIEALTLHYDRYYTSKHRPAREKGFAHRPPNLCANASQGRPAEHREESRPFPRLLTGELINSAAGEENVSCGK